MPARRLQREIGLSAMGGLAGAGLLLVTTASVFVSLVPALLLFATVLFALEPGLLVVAIYGGYFNGGLGILLLALHTLTGEGRIHTVNALKNLNSLALSLLSVVAFVLAGVIAWPQGLVMMVAATRGGFGVPVGPSACP